MLASALRFSALLICLAFAQSLPPSAVLHAQSPAATESDNPAAGRGFMQRPGNEAPKSAWGRPDGETASAPAPPPEQVSSWWRAILEIQQQLHRKLAGAVKDINTNGSVEAGLTLILISFLYGVFHAAGPGHGKAVISSYVLANGATVRRGITLSVLASMLQAITAIALVTIFVIALNAVGLRVQQMVQRFETASGILIVLTGLWLLAIYMRRRFATQVIPSEAHAHAHAGSGHTHDHSHHQFDHAHDENCGCGHSHMPDPRAIEKNTSLANAAAIIFAIGIRPCTGAILVLVFALTQGLFWAGVASTFAMAAGTAITVSTLALLAVGSRNIALRYAGSRWTTGIYDVAAIGGSLLVILLGAGLFWASLGPVKPF